MEGKYIFFLSIVLLVSVAMTQGSKDCPNLKRPDLGTVSCVGFEEDKWCTARCLPDHIFKNHEDKKEVIHKCKDGKWEPSDKFPECIPDGLCMFDFEEYGNAQCGITKERKICEITCGTKIEGKFSCVNGKWDPPLPSCAKVTAGDKS